MAKERNTQYSICIQLCNCILTPDSNIASNVIILCQNAMYTVEYLLCSKRKEYIVQYIYSTVYIAF